MRKGYIIVSCFILMLVLLLTGAACADIFMLPENLQVIEEEAFMGDSSLTEIVIPDGVVSIGDRAFAGCGNLTAVTFPDSVESIGSDAFSNCGSLTIYCNANSVAHAYAMDNGISYVAEGEEPLDTDLTVGRATPVNITSGGEIVYFPFVPEETGIYYFYSEGSSNTFGYLFDADLNEITSDDYSGDNGNFRIVCSLTAGTEYCFGAKFFLHSETGSFTVRLDVLQTDENGLSYIDNHDGTYKVAGYEGSAGAVVIPETFNGKPVGSIGDHVFYDLANLSNVTLPESITSIGNSAFSCSGLTSITIPASVVDIGDDVFSNCFKLNSFQVQSGNPAYKSVDGVLFSEDGSELLIYPFGKPDTTYIVPDSVIRIAHYAFSQNNSLVSVSIPDSVTILERSAFFGCRNLVSVSLPGNLTIISDALFQYCSSLKSIVLPDSLVNIGSAFIGCSSLTEITIPAGVTHIENGAFMECSSLPRITVANGNTSYQSIDGVLFNTDATLLLQYPAGKPETEYIVPDSVTTIDSRSFGGCSNLRKITIPASVTSIGEFAFYNCNLTIFCDENSAAHTYAMDNGINYVISGEEPLYTDLTVGGSSPVNITVAGEIVYFPFVPEETGIYYFYSEGNHNTFGYLFDADLNEIASDDNSGENSNFRISCELTAGVEYSFGAKYHSDYQTGSFTVRLDILRTDENGLTYMDNHDGTCMVTEYNGSANVVVIPETFNGMPVGSIGDEVFFYRPNLISITLPDSITSIGIDAFAYCSNLTGITIPANVTSIGSYAYAGLSCLTNVTLPASLVDIGNRVFSDCSNLQSIQVEAGNPVYKSIDGVLFSEDGAELLLYPSGKPDSVYTVPDGVVRIVDSAFSYNNYLTSVAIPDSVTSLDGYAFCYCRNLVSVSLPDSLTEVNNHLFMGCSSLTDVNIPGSAKDIGYAAFADCSSLDNIILPNSLVRIGGSAFSGCASLTEITIPAGVSQIDIGAFSGCSSLPGITVADGNTAYQSIEGVLFNADATLLLQYPAGKPETEYTVPDSVTTINSRSFMDCSGLKKIKIPASVTNIGNELTFYRCNLTIFCDENSAAHIFAIDNGISYVIGGDEPPYTDLTVGGSSPVYIIEDGEIVYFPFVPEETGIYYFYSEGNSNTFGYLFDADLNEIASDDNSGENSNFRISCELTAGVEYSFGAKYRSDYQTGSFTVRLDILRTDENGLTYMDNHDGTYKLTGYEGSAEAVVIPDTFNGVPVANIGDYAFYNRPHLISVTLPDSITSIGSYGFAYSYNLTDITISDNITSIGNYAFASLSNLTSISLPASLVDIGDRIFSNCSNLQSIQVQSGNPVYKSVDGVLYSEDGTELLLYPSGKSDSTYIVPDDVVRIADSAFSQNKNLTSVTIPDSVTNLEGYAFDGCQNLVSVILPDSLTEVSNHLFMGCSSLTDVNIPVSATSIWYAAFANCSSLDNIILPDSLVNIGGSAFAGCSSLTEITIPTSVNRIDMGAFSGCSSLPGITVVDANTAYQSIDGVLFNADATLLLQYPAGKPETEYTVPDSVTTINSRSFMDCSSLIKVTIPASVTSIGNELTFYRCDNLTIYGEQGSCAETYATGNGIPFVAE